MINYKDTWKLLADPKVNPFLQEYLCQLPDLEKMYEDAHQYKEPEKDEVNVCFILDLPSTGLGRESRDMLFKAAITVVRDWYGTAANCNDGNYLAKPLNGKWSAVIYDYMIGDTIFVSIFVDFSASTQTLEQIIARGKEIMWSCDSQSTRSIREIWKIQ